MSSVYSSAAISRRPSHIASPSSFTPPEYHDGGYDYLEEQVDLDAVFRKLEKYRSELQEAEARLHRQRSFSAKEVEEVAAATRFKLDLERLEQFDFEEAEQQRQSRLQSIPPLRKSSLHPKAAAKQSSKTLPAVFDENWEATHRPMKKRRSRPEPILVPGHGPMPLEVQSARLPPRTSSRAVMCRESDPEASKKSHRRQVTISEGRGSARNVVLMSSPSLSGAYREHDLPPLPAFPDFIPALSPSSSTTTAKFSNPPATPLSLCPPNEDQIRREIELFTLHDGAEPLVGNQYRRRTPPELNLQDDIEDRQHDFKDDLKQPRKPLDDDQRSARSNKSLSSIKSVMKRRKSIFSVFQRRSEVDKLLDLYFNNEPTTTEKQTIKKRPSIARRMARSRRNSNHEVPELPPLPAIVAGHLYGPS